MENSGRRNWRWQEAAFSEAFRPLGRGNRVPGTTRDFGRQVCPNDRSPAIGHPVRNLYVRILYGIMQA